MSSVEMRLFVRASPERARSLFTVRAAISVARRSLAPRSRAPSLMCLYCLSRFELDPLGMVCTFSPKDEHNRDKHHHFRSGRRTRNSTGATAPGRLGPSGEMCSGGGRTALLVLDLPRL